MSFDIVNAQSYIPSFDILFNKYSIKRVLEFGGGDGTRYLLDNADFVCSVEIVAYPYHKEWAEKCAKLYKEDVLKNKWVQLVLPCSENMIKIDQKCQKGIQTNFSMYEKEMNFFLQEAFKHGHYDLAFVDYGIHMRADMVNLLFEKVKVIAAHDTNISPEMYGWEKISPPLGYIKKIFHNEYLGTTFWIRD